MTTIIMIDMKVGMGMIKRLRTKQKLKIIKQLNMLQMKKNQKLKKKLMKHLIQSQDQVFMLLMNANILKKNQIMHVSNASKKCFRSSFHSMRY